MTDVAETLERLNAVIDGLEDVAVAISGGVDSLTLGVAVHRRNPGRAEMFHAVSPAVPEAATERVRAMSAAEGWRLRIVEANEFDDADYLANPVDRCFYCKRDLYGAIRELTSSTILSGTNLDDLADYRPGLDAAGKSDVRHPFVEVAITKDDVRALASHLGLGDVADLPAAPCLSSRVETGLVIRADWLRVGRILGQGTLWGLIGHGGSSRTRTRWGRAHAGQLWKPAAASLRGRLLRIALPGARHAEHPQRSETDSSAVRVPFQLYPAGATDEEHNRPPARTTKWPSNAVNRSCESRRPTSGAAS